MSILNNNNHNNGFSPPSGLPGGEENPMLTAYDQFVRNTPLVTRYILTGLGISYVLSWFGDLSFALGTTPYFCLHPRWELYRIITSPFICQSLLSLIFAYLSFLDMGKRLEHSLGSTAFGYYILLMGICTNIAFLIICYTLYFLTNNTIDWLYWNSVGIWTLIFAIIATDCSSNAVASDNNSQRRLFFVMVPTKYFPLFLYALFMILGSVGMVELLAIGIGYAYGYGYMNKYFKATAVQCQEWEDSILYNFTQRPGWITGHIIMGSSAWSEEYNNSNANPFHFLSSSPSSTMDTTTNTRMSSSLPITSTTTRSNSICTQATTPVFTGDGCALGRSSSTPRHRLQSLGVRAAMLEAAEKRAASSSSKNDDLLSGI